MKTIEEVRDLLKGIKYMTYPKAQIAQQLIRESNCKDILELGTFHGVGTNYLCAVASQNGGHVTTIDKDMNAERIPSIDYTLHLCGLKKYCTVVTDPMSYTWVLTEYINQGKKFDFIYIDGGHLFDNTALAFHLSDRLLIEGGVLVFDDLTWRPCNSRVKNYSQKELPLNRHNLCHVGEVWNKLVKTHPNYTNFEVKGNWGICRKVAR